MCGTTMVRIVSPFNSSIENLTHNVMVFGDGPFKR